MFPHNRTLNWWKLFNWQFTLTKKFKSLNPWKQPISYGPIKNLSYCERLCFVTKLPDLTAWIRIWQKKMPTLPDPDPQHCKKGLVTSVLVPYLDHKNKSTKKMEKILPFCILSFYSRKNLISFITFSVKCEWKKC